MIGAAAALAISACTCWPACNNARYDDLIVTAADKQRLPPRWLKAQLIAESGLRPDAQSPVGAQGLGQIMPGTWADIARAHGWIGASPFNVARNTLASAYYQRRMLSIWRARPGRTWRDRYSLALASYNAGAGNLIKAQRRAGGAVQYPPIAAALPEVTGRHATETTTYVRRITCFAGRVKRL